jgi:NAD(P)H-flavin reductase
MPASSMQSILKYVSRCDAQIRAFINDKWETRSFTPIRFDDGICELFYRVYPAPEGIMSRHLQSLQQDAHLEIMGPVGDPNLKHQVIKSGLTAFSASRAKVILLSRCDSRRFVSV